MYMAKVKFDNVVDAQKFVGICNDMDFKVELMSGAYIIDAKSIMGIFSLDFSSRWSCGPTARRTAALPKRSPLTWWIKPGRHALLQAGKDKQKA